MSNARFEAGERSRRAFARFQAANERCMSAGVVEFLMRMELERLEADLRRLTALLEKERPAYEAAQAAIAEVEATLKEHKEIVVYGEEETEAVIYLWEHTDHRPQIYALTTLAQDMLSNRPNPIPFKTSL